MRYVKKSDYLDACYNSIGWCTTCKEFTGDCVEPDAEDYFCEECEQDSIFGAEQAFLMSLIDIKEDKNANTLSKDVWGHE